MNTAPYIDIPFQEHGRDFTGADCWGLIRLVYQKELRIEMPSYDDYESIKDDDIPEKLELRAASEWVKQDKPKLFDVVLCRMNNAPRHVGIYVGNQYMLHITKGINSCCEKINNSKWSNRVMGYYRHPSLA